MPARLAATLAALLATAGADPQGREGGAREVPGWVTFEVLDPATLGGHGIRHLEDVIGPNQRRDVPGLPDARAMLIFTVRPEDCARVGAGLCHQVARATAEARKRGAVVLGVIQAERETAGRVRAVAAVAGHPFPVTVDTHGVARRFLGLDGPGLFLVVHSDLRGVRVAAPAAVEASERRSRHLDDVQRALAEALRRDEEGER